MKAIEQAIEARALKLANSRLDDKRGSYEWALDAEITLRECAAALSALRSMPAEPVACIQWTLNGNKTCGYDNWVGETPFGRILITWKGWKEDPVACIEEFPGQWPNIYGSPDEVKAGAEAEFIRRLRVAVALPEPDCAGGSPCSDCPDKRKCQAGCVRQGEAIATPPPAPVLSNAERDCAGGMPCATCPDKRKCQCGCIRQGEALTTPHMVLSDAEIEEIVSSMMVSEQGYLRFSASLRDFARAIERAAIRASKGGKL